jgi:hypothetical protein
MESFNLNTQGLEVTIDGKRDVRTSGEAMEQRIIISGSGDYMGRDLQSAEAEVQILGSGSATVRVRDRLVVRISGSGSVFYLGEPVLERIVTGPGDVIKIEEQENEK